MGANLVIIFGRIYPDVTLDSASSDELSNLCGVPTWEKLPCSGNSLT